MAERADDDEFSGWLACEAARCPACGSDNVFWRAWITSGEAYVDRHFKCAHCGGSWWSDDERDA